MDLHGIYKEFPVKGGDFARAGEAAGKLKNILKQIGAPYGVIKRVAIASYEMEMNIVLYADEGKLCVNIKPREVFIVARDRGPGIPNTEKAMEEGYSTASAEIREMGFGAGMGLPNIKKASDWMQIDSEVGVGTCVQIKFFFNGKTDGV
ncbi:MAG: ATP-binding protein [bacterium]